MNQVLVKMPRPIAQKIVDIMIEKEGAPEIIRYEAEVFYACLKDALASKPLNERTMEPTS
jgi:hypothetical protein